MRLFVFAVVLIIIGVIDIVGAAKWERFTDWQVQKFRLEWNRGWLWRKTYFIVVGAALIVIGMTLALVAAFH